LTSIGVKLSTTTKIKFVSGLGAETRNCKFCVEMCLIMGKNKWRENYACHQVPNSATKDSFAALLCASVNVCLSHDPLFVETFM